MTLQSRITKKTYGISELSKEFDITTRTIRFYEQQGLISPTRNGQTRIYSEKDRVRLMLTLRGKRLGFSLAETKELFDLYDTTLEGDEKQLNLILGILGEKKAELDQQLQDIQRVQTELNLVQDRCQKALDEVLSKKTQS
ncbi:MerR family transcriptional regulator [Oceanospirillum linum]|uniref:MerR family transcriptional regulator n=1 Tax=Oceanospirillum linum TaxID=966 RepID=A0A1T1HCC3_OCELI|nr:MerR family DNA-binding transcriptional regulator [Oceanospirillum linum]OOV87524.1 MerR family transcriptional regulator [Oceanospirillum linum]SEF90679.1 DNA-binding transcriptional regulator, MerR family [Oleiphilus messinensis]SMP13349.1 DNA-binding transcriptional regulator, MerR family [Oceanospirillum linum]